MENLNKQAKRPVSDYRAFLNELKAQLNVIRVFSTQFFELEDMCEWSLRNDVTVLNSYGVRVNIVDDFLGEQQRQWYKKFQEAASSLVDMLQTGEKCLYVNSK